MQYIEIKGKSIYIVESHHHILEAWEKYKGANVITFDWHTDTKDAFNVYAYWEARKKGNYHAENFQCAREIRRDLLKKYHDEGNITDVISKLRNDEHISFATLSNIVNFVFVCSHQSSSFFNSAENNFLITSWAGCRKDELALQRIFAPYRSPNFNPQEKLYSYHHQRIIECPLDCVPLSNLNGAPILSYGNFDLVIEDRVLEPILNNFNEFAYPFSCRGNQQSPYEHREYAAPFFILDFDMDYFPTQKSLNPKNRHVISNLIKNSCAITIATENGWSEEKWEDSEPIDFEKNLSSLLHLIEGAL